MIARGIIAETERVMFLLGIILGGPSARASTLALAIVGLGTKD